MSTSKFRVPKYCHHKATDRARVRVHGKYEFLPGKFNSRESRAAYQKVIEELSQQFVESQKSDRRSSDPVHGDCLVAELIVRYLQFATEYYSRSKQADCIRVALRPIRELFSGRQVDSIGPTEWKQIRQAFIDNGQTRSGINLCMGRILRMYRWGVTERLVKLETYQVLQMIGHLKKGRCGDIPEGKKRGAIGAAHIEAIKPHVNRTIWAMVQVQLLAGCRPGEVAAMTTGSLDRSGDVWVYKPESHKNAWREKERVVYLGPKAQLIITPFLLADPDSPIFSPRRAMVERWEEQRKSAEKPLYGERKRRIERDGFGGKALERIGERYTANAYRTAIKRACEAAGIPPWTPYQLRHTAAQEARANAGVEGVSAVLGNSIDAAQVYSERNLKLAREVAKRCG